MILQIATIRYKSPQNSLQIALFLGADFPFFLSFFLNAIALLCKPPPISPNPGAADQANDAGCTWLQSSKLLLHSSCHLLGKKAWNLGP